MALREFSLRVPPSCRPGEAEKTKRDVTEIVEEYVEGIYRLREDVGRVTTGELAQYMVVSPGSATSMVKKLAQLGLVTHAPYKSIELTPEGERLAKQVTRTHRVLKRFLVDIVGLPWNDVHDLACKLEHYVSTDVVDRMYEVLGQPEKCPHGNPIDPDVDDSSIRLAEASIGDELEVQKVTNESFEFLSFLEDTGLLPGRRATAVGATEFDGLIHLIIDGQPVTVGREVSRHVWVRKV
ncbi:MAG TPA: metal-dependent transcriptional regulator [Fimbriimonadales bacterium]|jgi:DtxR family Mn-dependent transcriptional regulator|nr:metal-dependent transcriptional regulator [Fimbriimonadales bacterium]